MKQEKELKPVEFEIEGMSCTSCALNIENSLKKQNFVKDVRVEFTSRKAWLTLSDPSKFSEVSEIIHRLGYEAKVKDKWQTEEYVVEGMSCTSCALNVENALQKTAGVLDARVDFTTRRVLLKKEKDVSFEKLAETVRNAGYTLVPRKEEKEDAEERLLKKEKRNLLIIWAFVLPLSLKMVLEMFFGIVLISPEIALWTDLILSFVVIFILRFSVIRSTWFAVKNLAFNMDSLIGIGATASFLTGILRLSGMQIQNFSVVGAMIVAIDGIGNYLKKLSTGKASQAIRKLMELEVKQAHLLNKDGSFQDVPVSSLKPGDRLMVKPGEKFPVDGIILEGETSADESIATGESIPVDKKKGDWVIGATLNQLGNVVMEAQKVGEDTFLSGVIRMVEEAQAGKVPIQALADKITAVFVPIILFISVFTFVFWNFFPEIGNGILQSFSFLPWVHLERSPFSQAIFASVATLVIACPCALGLATPTALMVGMGKGAENGVLFRKGESVQRMGKVTVVVFDKTGTLTKGKPEVKEVFFKDREEKFFDIAFSLESLSEHPLADAVKRFLSGKNAKKLSVSDFTVIPGKGVKGKVEGAECLLGRIDVFSKEGIDLEAYQSRIEEFQKKAYTIIGLSVDGQFYGGFALSDLIKENAADVISDLKSLGLKTVMLTGDHHAPARLIAKECGITKFYAELLPQDKIAKIKELQSDGEVVAMVGDGINDAPSLKQADIGIAIGTGTDIAIEASDISLVSGRLIGVYRAFVLSKKIFSKIKQNLFWAFFYNSLMIPVAVLGLLHPVIAETAMALSSLNVLSNSLRLKSLKLK